MLSKNFLSFWDLRVLLHLHVLQLCLLPLSKMERASLVQTVRACAVGWKKSRDFHCVELQIDGSPGVPHPGGRKGGTYLWQSWYSSEDMESFVTSPSRVLCTLGHGQQPGITTVSAAREGECSWNMSVSAISPDSGFSSGSLTYVPSSHVFYSSCQ